VGYPPGGGTDLLARLIGSKLDQKWSKPIIVDNRPGGNGIISAQAAKAARPDGYTLLLASSDHFVLVPNMYSGLPYDPVKDYVPIINVAKQHFVLVVNPSVPAKSLTELVKLIRAQPKLINFASWGEGGGSHLAAEYLKTATKTDFLHVPYKGTAPAIAAVIAGQDISAMFATAASAIPNIKAGKLRGLAVTSNARLSMLPDVPTMGEEGFPNTDMYSWNGLFAPMGTPADVVAKIQSDVATVLGQKDVVDQLQALGLEPVGGSSAEFATQLKHDLTTWGSIVRDAGIRKKEL